MNEFDPSDITTTHEEACVATKAEMLGDLSNFASALNAIKKGVENNDNDG